MTVAKPDRPCCDTCRFADPIVNQGVQLQHDGIGLWECRRHAPVVVMSGHAAQREWPNVLDIHWCGDHEDIASADEDEDEEVRRCPNCQSTQTILITQGDRQFTTCAKCSRILGEAKAT